MLQTKLSVELLFMMNNGREGWGEERKKLRLSSQRQVGVLYCPELCAAVVYWRAREDPMRSGEIFFSPSKRSEGGRVPKIEKRIR